MLRRTILAAGLACLVTSAGAATPARKAPPPPIGADSSGMFFVSYPDDSLWDREEGTVHYRVGVDKNGVVTDCVVTKSSGHKRLDRVTCAAAVHHARFIPEKDEKGRRVSAVYDGQVVWSID